MSITLREVRTPKDEKLFLYLPERLHKDHHNWVPPIYSDEQRVFDPKRNRAFAYCDFVRVLAEQDGEIVGRISAVLNRRYNDEWKCKVVRFGYLECPNDQSVAKALLGFAEEWGKQRGMEKIVGPNGFTEEDPQGFQVEGFENIPNLATYCNFPYIPPLLESIGYSKEVDYVVYKLDIKNAITDFYKWAYDRVSKNKQFVLKEFATKKEIKPHIHAIFHLMNECFQELYGYSSLDEQEMDQLARRYLPVIDPRFIKAVTTADGEMIGFIVGIPNFADGIRAARGRIFPFGFLKIIKAAKKSRKLDLYLGGVKAAYRRRGIDVLMGYRMLVSARDAGFEYIDSHHELETNVKMRAEMEKAGGKIYKRFRLFHKMLK
jgi:GNAT superfamily N-acetyltransferase